MKKDTLALNKKRILKSFFLFPVVSAIISILILTISFVLILNNFENKQITTATQTLLKAKKSIIKKEATGLSFDIKNQISLTEKITKKELKRRVYQASTLINYICKNYPKKDQMQMSLGILSSLTFNDGKGYFFAYNRRTGIVKLHGIKKIIGKNTKKILTKQNIHPYDRNEKILNNSKQEGYFITRFQKPNIPNKRFEKIDFIKYIKALNLVIGTGEYTDDVLKNIKANMLQRVSLKRYDRDKYFAIINTQGVLLSHPYLKKDIGKNIIGLKDKTGKPFIKEVLKIIQKNSEGYIKYYWLNPRTNKTEQKIGYVILIKELNWIILTGIYIPEVEKSVKIAKQKMKKEYQKVYCTAAFIIIAYIIAIFFVLTIFSKHLKTIFNQYDLLMEEKRKKAEYNATHDVLTKANNRASFDKKLKEECERALRYKRDLSIAMLDIDYFKKINDTLGHQVGDIVLKNLSVFCKSQIRNSDFFARWGGEEFMFIFSETDIKTAIKICDKLRKNIFSNKKLQQVSRYTVSIGVTQLKPDDTVDSLMKRVDDALYSAKNNGRNTVESL